MVVLLSYMFSLCSLVLFMGLGSVFSYNCKLGYLLCKVCVVLFVLFVSWYEGYDIYDCVFLCMLFGYLNS